MALYNICVATDLAGAKVNLLFSFDQYGPSTAQLLSRASEAFAQVFRLRGYSRIFAISSAVVFNEALRTWDRLERSSQLLHNSQVYIFQPDVVDVPGELPDPIPAYQFLVGYASPKRDEEFSRSPRPPLPTTFGDYVPVSRSSPALEEHRTKMLHEREVHAGEVVPGASILKEERAKEDMKDHLSLDEHRELVRREAREFSNSLSPVRESR